MARKGLCLILNYFTQRAPLEGLWRAYRASVLMGLGRAVFTLRLIEIDCIKMRRKILLDFVDFLACKSGNFGRIDRGLLLDSLSAKEPEVGKTASGSPHPLSRVTVERNELQWVRKELAYNPFPI